MNFSISFNYVSRQQATIASAYLCLATNMLKIMHIFISHYRCLKISGNVSYTHHYFKIMLVIRSITDLLTYYINKEEQDGGGVGGRGEPLSTDTLGTHLQTQNCMQNTS